MTITRRRTLGMASAFALIGSTEAGFAFRSRQSRYQNLQTTQSFIMLLIHRDEGKGTPHSAPIWISSSDTAWYAVDTMSAGLYSGTNKTYKKRGYRLERVSAFRTKEGVRYAAIWELGSGPEWQSSHGMTLAEFNQARGQYGSGWRMTHVNAHQNFSAIWEKGDASIQQILVSLSASDFQTQMGQLVSNGYRPLRISTTGQGNQLFFTAIFEKNSGSVWQAQSLMSAAQFDAANAKMLSQGYKLTDASGVMLGKKPSFTGIWDKI